MAQLKFIDPYETPEQQHADDLAGDVSWGDYAKALAAGSTDVIGSVPALTRWMGESMPEDSLFGQMLSSQGRHAERKLNETAQDVTSSMSDSAQIRALATIGSSDFLAHPFSSLALKTTRTAPSIAASIGATLFTAGGAPSMAAIAAISGGLSAGETLNEMYTAVDNMGDKDLRKSSTIYDGYRKRGLSEDQARRELDRAMVGYKPFGLFALGAVTGVVGPAGQIAGTLGKAGLTKAATAIAEKGILKRVGAEAAQGAGSEFVQTGAEQFSQEKAAVDVGLQSDIRWGNVGTAALEGGLIGGILGGPTGIKSHTNANPRPNPINPPAAAVTNAVKPNQASVPARGSNTTASPPVVPAKGAGYTGPTSRAATIPGATPNQKKPKVAPNATTTTAAGTPAATTATTPATPATGTVAGLAPNTYTPASRPAPQASQGDPKGLVAGQTELAALNTQVAPTGISGAPINTTTPEEAARAAAGGWQGQGTQVRNLTREEYDREQAAKDQSIIDRGGTVGTLTPAGNVASAPVTAARQPVSAGNQQVITPGLYVDENGIHYDARVSPDGALAIDVQQPDGSMRSWIRNSTANVSPVADNITAKFHDAVVSGRLKPVDTATAPAPTPAPQVPAQTPGAGFGAGPEAAPVVQGRPSAFGGVEQPVAPAPLQEAAPAPVAPVAPVHPSMQGVEPLKGKDRKRNEKVLSDHVIAQSLLDERPTNPTVPTTEEGINALATEVQDILTSATKQGVEFRGKVGSPTTPHSLVWLREAQEFVSKLRGKNVKLADKQAAAIRFLDREASIRKGEGVRVKAERNAEGEAAMAARGKGKGKVTEQTVEGATVTSKAAKASELPPTETREIVQAGGLIKKEDVAKAITRKVSPEARAEIEARTAAQNVEAVKAKAAEAAKPQPLTEPVAEKVQASKKRTAAKKAAQEANLPAGVKVEKLVSAAVKADGKIYTGKSHQEALPDLIKRGREVEPDDIGYITTKGRFVDFDEALKIAQAANQLKNPKTSFDSPNINFAEPRKTLGAKVTPEAVAKAKAAQEAKKAPPKPSAPAASSADFAEQVKAEVEPNPSNAQIEADNASKAHVNIEGMPLAIETAANTERHIVLPNGSRVSRLLKYAYGHILGTKSTDGQPIDIFLGPEAYPNNPKLEGLPVVIIEQVDPDTKLPDEPKVMYGFERVTDPNKGTGAVEAYKDSYPRGDERIGDVVTMTPNEFKQWRISKQEAKNAQEHAGVVGSELDDLIAEQTGEISAERAEDLESVLEDDIEAYGDQEPRRLRLAQNTLDDFNQVPLENQVAYSRRRAELQELAAAAAASDTGTVSSFLDEGVKQQNSKERVGYGLKERALFPHVMRRIKALAGDVKVYVVSGSDLKTKFGKSENVAGFYNDAGGFIVINGDLSPIQFARTVLHEGIHAAFVKATLEHPELMTQLDKILEEAYAKWRDVPLNWHRGAPPYGLTSIHEVLAEALSNPRFQEFLLNTKASNELVKELGLDGKYRSMWDVLMRFIGKIFKLPKSHDSLLSAVLKVSSKLELAAPDYEGAISDKALGNNLRYKSTGLFPTDIESRLTDTVSDLRDRLPPKVSRLLGSTALSQEQAGSPWLMAIRTMDQIIQSAKNYGRPFYEHLRKVGDTIERTRTTAEKYFNETVPLIRESHALEGKYKGSGTWQRFVELAMEATRVQIYPDRPLASQTHLGKDTLRGAQPKAEWAALNAEYEALKLAAPDLMNFYTRSQQFYRDQQNKMRVGIIRDSLKVTGFTDPDLAQRLFDGTETDADKAALGDIYDHIKDASELAKVEVYFPQMRRGNWVVRGNYKITAPTNALRQIDENTWEFAGKGARKQAMAYAASQKGTGMVATPVSVWVDTNTGERYFNLGQPDEVRVRPTDTDAEQRFRVTVQNRYVSFHESKREALKVSEELKAIPGVDADSVAPVVERKFNPGDQQADLMSHQMQTLANSLQRRSGFQNLSDFEKNQVVQAFNTASLRLLGSTRIQSKRLPRTNVLGASNNFTQNMTEYAQSTSGYLAKLDHNDELNTAMREARKEADSHNDYNKSAGQSQIMNVMEKRVTDSTAFENSGKFHEWGNRLLAMGFASRLISPAYNIINALQVAMITYPALASRFGPGRAAMMLLRTYREVGVGKALKGGLIASKRTLLQGPDVITPSIVDDMIASIKSPQVRAMLKHLIEVGSIDADSGIEVPTMIETRTGVMGLIDQGINYTSTFGRQMPRSIEAINRVVTAVASYNLEMQRSGDHDIATRFAQETTNTTQGHYAHSNAAPVFNHPLGRLSFQFKKFPQLIYNMIGQNIGKAIMNAEPGDRAEAVKTLAYMAATHFVMAGALGLPQEPLKWLIIGARQVGVTDLSWGDVENYEREMLSSAFGQQLGEIAARGITRALPEGFAFDLSSRVGLQDMATWGEPRSADAQDLKAFLWDTVGGAPATQLGDWIRGSQALMKGDWAEASQRFSPVKMLTDAIKAGRTTSGSQKTAAGYEKLSPYGVGEAALRAFGFTPAREAETNEARSYYASAQKSATAARDTMLHRWADAAPSERGRIWGQVEKFNYGKAKDERLTRSDLDRYAKRRRTEEKSGLVQGGFRVTKRDKPLYKKVQGTYSYQ